MIFPVGHTGNRGAREAGTEDRHRVRRKLALLLGSFIVGFCALCVLGNKTLTEVQVGGPIYADIIDKHELIADVLPPPAYVVESYLLVFELLEERDATAQQQLIERLKSLSASFDERHRAWRKRLPADDLRQAFLVDSYVPAVEFYRIIAQELIPAVQRGDSASAHALAVGRLKQRYQVHRAAIDQVVRIAKERGALAEASTRTLIEGRWLLLALLGTGIGIAVLAFSLVVSQQVLSASQTLEREITERKRAEEELRSSEALRREALRQGDNLKSALLMCVTHDLRSPLAAIDASAQLMCQSDDPQARKEHLEAIGFRIGGMLHLVTNLLEMSRIEAGALNVQREWQQLEEVVEGALRRTGTALEGRQLELELADDLPPVFIDGVLMLQVLANLLDNAIKYSLPGSSVSLKGCMRDGAVQIAVSSRGEVIPTARLEQIFTPFYRSPPPQGTRVPGSGLGLAICKGIIEAHQGSIQAQSTLDGITTLTVTLPQPAHGTLELEQRLADAETIDQPRTEQREYERSSHPGR